MGYVLNVLCFVSVSHMNKGKVVNFFDFLQNLKLCGFYMFQKEYLDEFVEKKIIRIYCQQIEELEEEEDEGMKQLEIKLDEMKQLEMKLEKMMCKMNIVIVCLAIVVLAAVVKLVV